MVLKTVTWSKSPAVIRGICITTTLGPSQALPYSHFTDENTRNWMSCSFLMFYFVLCLFQRHRPRIQTLTQTNSNPYCSFYLHLSHSLLWFTIPSEIDWLGLLHNLSCSRNEPYSLSRRKTKSFCLLILYYTFRVGKCWYSGHS